MNVGRDVRAWRTGSSGRALGEDGTPGAPSVQMESSEYCQSSHRQWVWRLTHNNQTHQRPAFEPGAKLLVLWRIFLPPRSRPSKHQETLWAVRDYHYRPQNHHLLSVQCVLSTNVLLTLGGVSPRAWLETTAWMQLVYFGMSSQGIGVGGHWEGLSREEGKVIQGSLIGRSLLWATGAQSRQRASG